MVDDGEKALIELSSTFDASGQTFPRGTCLHEHHHRSFGLWQVLCFHRTSLPCIRIARHSQNHASSLGKPTTARLTFSPLVGQLGGCGPLLLHPLPHPQMNLARARRTAGGARWQTPAESVHHAASRALGSPTDRSSQNDTTAR